MQRWIAATLAVLTGSSLMLAACGGGGAPNAATSTPAPTATLAAVKAQPLPTLSPGPYLRLDSFQFLDSQTGWLSASSCRDQPRPTPDHYGTTPTGPPTCKSGFYGTTHGGQTWSLLSHEAIGEFQFADPQLGFAVNNNTSCAQSPCPSTVYCTISNSLCTGTVLRTTDGGAHWLEAYTSTKRLSYLTIVDREAWVLAYGCDREDNRGRCILSLLKSRDAGVTWNETAIPVPATDGVPGFSFTISRPTARDAWIATTGTPGVAQQLFSTHDDGLTWQTLPSAPALGRDAAIFFRTASSGWLLVGRHVGAGEEPKELFTTRNGGATWTHASGSLERPEAVNPGELPSEGYIGTMVFTSAQEGWLALARRGLLHSTDGGVHWTYVNVDERGGEVQPGIQFVDPLHGWTVSQYYAGLLQALWATEDGGATWQKVPLPAPEGP